MLEDLAIAYATLSSGHLLAIGYAFTVLGGLIAAIGNRSTATLARAPYFAYTALIFFAVSAMQIVWLQFVQALTRGHLWVLVLITIAARIIAGFFFGRIAAARSRDAYGHGRLAALAFIPLANLWLLFTASKSDVPDNRMPTIRVFSGELGVLSGLLLLFTGTVVSAFVAKSGQQIAAELEQDPAAQQSAIDSLVQAQGIERALDDLVRQARVPARIDDVTTLQHIEAQGSQLIRTYVVTLAGVTLTNEFRRQVVTSLCAHPLLMPLFHAGATIREVYVTADMSPIGEFTVSPQDCGISAP
jgi:hypothetical protein